MLQPSQLADVADQYAADVVELRAFLAKAGVHVGTPQAIATVASRVQHDKAFHRDLTVTLWMITEGGDRQIGFAELLGVLAIASAGISFASDAEEQDALTLLQFLKEIRRAREPQAKFRPDLNTDPAAPQDALLADELVVEQVTRHSNAGDEQSISQKRAKRILPWPRMLLGRHSKSLVAGGCLLLFLALTVWIYRRSSAASPGIKQAPMAANARSESPEGTPEATQASPGRATHREVFPLRPGIQHSTEAGAQRPVTPKQANTQSSTTESFPPDQTRTLSASPTASASTGNPALATKGFESASAAPRMPPSPTPSTVLAPRTISPSARTSPIPASLLSKRLGTPTLPQSSSGPSGEGVADVPRRPRLLRRHTNTSDDSSLVAELQPMGNPAVIPPSTTAGTRVGSVQPVALGIMAANVLYSPVPSYPVAASAAHVTGEVKLEAEIDRDGTVTYARVVSGPPLLRDAALNAVQQWRYRPYLSRGKAVPFTTLAVMDFQLP